MQQKKKGQILKLVKPTSSAISISTELGNIKLLSVANDAILDPKKYVPVFGFKKAPPKKYLVLPIGDEGTQSKEIQLARIYTTSFGTRKIGTLFPGYVLPSPIQFRSVLANYISSWDGWAFRLRSFETNVYVDIDRESLVTIPDNRMHLLVFLNNFTDNDIVASEKHFILRVNFGYIYKPYDADRGGGRVILSVFIGNSQYNPILIDITHMSNSSFDIILPNRSEQVTFAFERKHMPENVETVRYTVIMRSLHLFLVTSPIPPLHNLLE